MKSNTSKLSNQIGGRAMSKNTTDELDELLGKLIFDVHKSASNGETIDKVMVLSLKTKQAIQAHVDKKVNKVLGELNKEIFFSSANPDGQLVKNLILNKRRTIKKLRSEL